MTSRSPSDSTRLVAAGAARGPCALAAGSWCAGAPRHARDRRARGSGEMRARRSARRRASSAQGRDGRPHASASRAKLRGTLPSRPIASPEPKTVAAIDKARTSCSRRSPRACGGANKSCAGDDGRRRRTDDRSPAIGWDLGTCPGFEGLRARTRSRDCADVARVHRSASTDAAVGQATSLYYDAFTPAAASSALGKCQVAIGKESREVLRCAVQGAAEVRRSRAARQVRGTVPIDGDVAAHDRQGRGAEGRPDLRRVWRRGPSRVWQPPMTCSPTAIGFAAQLPERHRAGRVSCGSPSRPRRRSSMCVDCVTSFKDTCLDALAVPVHEAVSAIVRCSRRRRRRPPTPTPSTASTPSPTPTPPAGSGGRRMRAVCSSRKRARFVQTQDQAPRRLRARRSSPARVPPTHRLPDTIAKVVDALTKATTRLTGHIAKACGGANRACDALDAGADADRDAARDRLVGLGVSQFRERRLRRSGRGLRRRRNVHRVRRRGRGRARPWRSTST